MERRRLRAQLAHITCMLCLSANPDVHAASDKASVTTDDPRVPQLLHLQEKASDGVFHLNPASFNELAVGRSRPYSVVIFLTANHLLDKSGLHLRQLRTEFGYLAKAYKAKVAKGETDSAGKLFFAEAEFKESQELFHRLGVNTLPYIFTLAQTAVVEADGQIKLRADDTMRIESYDNFPWTTDELGAFVSDRTGISVGKVDKPSIFTNPFFPVIAIAFLASGAYTAYQLYYAPFMKNLIIWTVGAITVYWFSVSGGMHNIIRGVPIYVLTQQGAQFFLPPGQGQLGGEGFICGTCYLAVGMAVSTLTYLTYLVPSDVKKQRVVAYVAITAGFWSFLQVVNLYRWKTGYRWRTYF